jgi:gamma-glutamylcyclotransferase (GGCT)/AIG2-like uncharacterized protein YtfP
MPHSLYAFYGSLRRGMRLYQQFNNDLQYLYNAWLPGYDLYSLGNYPYALRSADSTHKMMVEVMRILDSETEKSICKIENDAGYYAEKIQIGNHSVTIFLFETPANNLRIVSGDWGISFGQ